MNDDFDDFMNVLGELIGTYASRSQQATKRNTFKVERALSKLFDHRHVDRSNLSPQITSKLVGEARLAVLNLDPSVNPHKSYIVDTNSWFTGSTQYSSPLDDTRASLVVTGPIKSVINNKDIKGLHFLLEIFDYMPDYAIQHILKEVWVGVFSKETALKRARSFAAELAMWVKSARDTPDPNRGSSYQFVDFITYLDDRLDSRLKGYKTNRSGTPDCVTLKWLHEVFEDFEGAYFACKNGWSESSFDIARKNDLILNFSKTSLNGLSFMSDAGVTLDEA